MSEPTPQTDFASEAQVRSSQWVTLQAAPPDPLQAAPPDPLWVSALRGRLMAAIASAASLAASGAMLYRSVETLASGGTQVGMAGAVADIAQQAATVADAGLALTVAAASLAALVASLSSKAREWLRTRMGGDA